MGIGDPISRAFSALRVNPVPGFAASVGRLSVVGLRVGAASLNEVVSVVTGQTLATGDIVGAALVGNWDADSGVVEDPIS